MNERKIRAFSVVDNPLTGNHEYWLLNWKAADLPYQATDVDPMQLYACADFLAGVYHRLIKQIDRGEVVSFIQGEPVCKLPITG